MRILVEVDWDLFAIIQAHSSYMTGLGYVVLVAQFIMPNQIIGTQEDVFLNAQ
jgi:hypothetical protein